MSSQAKFTDFLKGPKIISGESLFGNLKPSVKPAEEVADSDEDSPKMIIKETPVLSRHQDNSFLSDLSTQSKNIISGQQIKQSNSSTPNEQKFFAQNSISGQKSHQVGQGLFDMNLMSKAKKTQSIREKKSETTSKKSSNLESEKKSSKKKAELSSDGESHLLSGSSSIFSISHKSGTSMTSQQQQAMINNLTLQNYILQLEKYDFQDMRQDQNIQSNLEANEVIIMSDKIELMNQYRDWTQMQILITQYRILIISLDGKKIKRSIECSQIQGLSMGYKGEDSKKNTEENLLSDFIIHVKAQHDIRGKSSNNHQIQLVHVLRFVYDKFFSKEGNLAVYGCFELKQYLKSKKDAERGNIKLPSDKYRINDMLKQYPNFQVILDQKFHDLKNGKKTNSFLQIQHLHNMISNQSIITGNSDNLHHGGYQRKDIGQMQSFQSSFFDESEQDEPQFILKDLIDEDGNVDSDDEKTNKIEDSFCSNQMVKQTKKVQEIPGVLGAVQGVVTQGAVNIKIQGFQKQAEWIQETQPDLESDGISSIQIGGYLNQSFQTDHAQIMQMTQMEKKIQKEVSDLNESIMDKSSASSALLSRDSEMTANLRDFESKYLLGQGAYGKVFLVQNKINCDKNKNQKKKKLPEFFAMKVIEKNRINGQKIQNIINEKRVLLEYSHPFIIDLHFVFENQKKTFFIMNFVRCGDLFKHLKIKTYFKESISKFYAAQIILALGFLHDSKITYRDLKLENVLLESDGYIVLADFGLSKFLDDQDGRMQSFVGTLPYMAPEIINNENYDRTVDWWALGIMLYEMMYGQLPFQHKNQKILFDKILNDKLDFPTIVQQIENQDGSIKQKNINISDEAKDLIAGLLCRNPKQRLGSKNDYKDIMNHPWFNEIDIRKLLAKKIRPPYRPQYYDNNK